MSPDLACPSKFSARAALPHSLPSSPLSVADVISWYVQVLRYFPTQRPPVKRAAPLVGRTWFVPMTFSIVRIRLKVNVAI